MNKYKYNTNYEPSWFDRGRNLLLKSILKKFSTEIPTKYEILEFGSGIGKNIETLLHFGNVDVIEPHEKDLLEVNLRVRNFYVNIAPFSLDRKYDVIVAMDVLEHIDNHQDIFSWLREQLSPGGILIVTVPAYPFLFSDHDRALSHYRRYFLNELISMRGELELVFSSYFNFSLLPLAILSRFHSLLFVRRFDQEKLANHHLPRVQSDRVPKLIDIFLFQFLWMECLLIHAGIKLPFGLTAIAIFKKRI